MDVPANFKFDTRIRARLLAKKTVTEPEIEKHMEALMDGLAHSVLIDLPQPAVGIPPEKPPRGSTSEVRAVAARPAPRSIAPAPLPVDDGWDDDDDDDEVTPKKVAADAGPKKVSPAAEVAPKAAEVAPKAAEAAPKNGSPAAAAAVAIAGDSKTAADEDEDDDDEDDDEDEDDEDDEDEDGGADE